MVASISSGLSGYYAALVSSGASASGLLYAQGASSANGLSPTIDPNVIAAYYEAKAGVSTTATRTTSTAPTYATAAPTTSALTSAVLSGGAFVDPTSVKLTATSSSPTQARDYRNLFALYQGLTALQGLAQHATVQPTTNAASLQTTFARGLSEVESFLGVQPFHGLTVADGTLGPSAQSSVSIPKPTSLYTTAAVFSGGVADLPDAFKGSVAFDATVASLNGTSQSVHFDLSDLGSEPRTIGNVVAYLNTQLQAAGVSTRVSVVRTPGAADTVQAGGRSITLGQNADSYALRVTSGPGETVSFEAPSTTPAVYVAQTSGLTASAPSPALTAGSANAASDVTRRILKFDGAGGTSGASPTATQTLAPSVSGVQAQVTGADGSLYVLANLSGASPDGQPIAGAGDAALLKYDSAGHLAYARTLGAEATSSGAALALSADGTQIAVVGSVTGPLSGAVSSTGAPPRPTSAADAPRSFASVYDTSQGQELWTQTTLAGTSSHSTAAAFGADGTLYVAGDASFSGAADPTLQQGYLQSFKATPLTGLDVSTSPSVVASDVVATGARPGDKAAGLVVAADGGVVTATTQQGDLVLQRYDVPLAAGAAPSASRDLGDLGVGGGVAGIALATDGAVVVAGSTGADLLHGAASNVFVGGRQAFVATVAADLAPAAGDRVTYLDTGSSDANATALSVSGNLVYVAGSIAGAPTDGGRGVDAQTGFVSAVDPSTGRSGWSNTFTGADDQAVPSAIAVSSTGSSILDRLGLPQGTLLSTPTSNLVADTSVRAGDQFYVRSGSGAARAVTISADETLSTLASKINAALGYAGSATVVTDKSGGGAELKIVANTTKTVELEPGLAGTDALRALGLTAGLVQAASRAGGAKTTPNVFAIKLSTSLDISTVASATAAQSVLKAALATIRTAYADLGAPAQATAAATTGRVPSYVSAQIADYQLALSRLTGTA